MASLQDMKDAVYTETEAEIRIGVGDVVKDKTDERDSTMNSTTKTEHIPKIQDNGDICECQSY
jgi:hypothetical protein